MSIRRLPLALASSVLMMTAAAAPAALAQDYSPMDDGLVQAPRSNWSFAVGAATDNRSKDASKTNGEGFVWGEAEWESASGLFYAGPSFETIDSSGGSNLEIKASAGVRPQWAGFDWDFNVAHKWQIDSVPGYDDDAWEFTGDVKRSIGPVAARLRVQHSPDSTGASQAWTWVALRSRFDLTNDLQLSAEVGRREQETSVDYTGGNIGLTYGWRNGIEFDLRYHATDANVPGETYSDRLVAGLSYAF